MSASLSTSPALLRQLSEPYPISPAQIERYREQGFIKLKHVFSPEVLDYYGREISDQVVRLNQLNKPMEERTTYEKAFLQIMNIWRKSELVAEFVLQNKRLGGIAAALMGVDGVRLYHDQALYKEAGGGYTPWHADQYYWPVSNSNTTTAWIPLQAVPLELGPLCFSVGSHRYGAGRDISISDESEAKISKALLEQKLPVNESPFDLGEVSFHMGWTFHRAGPNTTSTPRRVMTIIYIEDGIRLLQPKNKHQQADWDTWMPSTKIGEVVKTELNPVLYP